MILDVSRKVLALLSPKERRQAYLLLWMILLMALLDVIGIASIMPFLAVLANPDAVVTNALLKSVYDSMSFSDPQQFLFFLGFLVLVLLVISVTFKAATHWAIIKYTRMREYSIARRLAAGYFRQPYEWFLGRHSAELGKSVLSEVEMVVQGGLMPLLQLLAHGAVVLGIISFLVAVDPVLAAVVGGGMGAIYALIYILLRGTLAGIGRVRVTSNEERFKALSEAFGGIKEVKLGGLEQSSLARFDAPARLFARVRAIAQVAAMLPRYLLEIVAFGGMLVLILYLMKTSNDLSGILPIMGLYALAGYRLMPAVQMSYNYAVMLRFSDEALNRITSEFDNFQKLPCSDAEKQKALVPVKRISLQNLSYSYPGAAARAIQDLTFEIPARTTVGIVGSTGSGKTTTVDILLGLLEPQSGVVCVDDVVITGDNRRSWQSAIGYVPQNIFLSDETIAANIAFGVANKEIDQVRVERAAMTANLHEFIVGQLPDGYRTVVGERGVRLSGGQRQRIGIARALYHEPEVLVFDEATSALDNVTEQAVVDAVQNLGGETTIVMIAHRLSTVRECDRIFVLEQGRLVGEGTYDELNASNSRFRAMAGS